MSYFVAWIASAHDRLETIWMAAADKSAVMRAANTIDAMLGEDPYRTDAVMLGDENTLIVEPLAVDYRIAEDERRVYIVGVWMIGSLDD